MRPVAASTSAAMDRLQGGMRAPKLEGSGKLVERGQSAHKEVRDNVRQTRRSDCSAQVLWELFIEAN